MDIQKDQVVEGLNNERFLKIRSNLACSSVISVLSISMRVSLTENGITPAFMKFLATFCHNFSEIV